MQIAAQRPGRAAFANQGHLPSRCAQREHRLKCITCSAGLPGPLPPRSCPDTRGQDTALHSQSMTSARQEVKRHGKRRGEPRSKASTRTGRRTAASQPCAEVFPPSTSCCIYSLRLLLDFPTKALFSGLPSFGARISAIFLFHPQQLCSSELCGVQMPPDRAGARRRSSPPSPAIPAAHFLTEGLIFLPVLNT